MLTLFTAVYKTRVTVTCMSRFSIVKNKFRSMQNGWGGWGIIENRINPQVDTRVA